MGGAGDSVVAAVVLVSAAAESAFAALFVVAPSLQLAMASANVEQKMKVGRFILKSFKKGKQITCLRQNLPTGKPTIPEIFRMKTTLLKQGPPAGHDNGGPLIGKLALVDMRNNPQGILVVNFL